jgi:hypothetical protein
MIHVICSRWGKKYSIEYVNNLYSMVKRNMPTEFKFYCQTDDTQGMNSSIVQLPFLDDIPESKPEDMLVCDEYKRGLPRLWDRPKLNYFNPNCWGIDGTKIALDLDLIIQNDMTPLLDSFKDKPITGRSWWHNMDMEKKPFWRKNYGAKNNGGFYMWQGDQFSDIWDDILKNWKKIYFVFTGGSDNFISTRHLNKFDFISHKHYYSFNRGCIWPDDIQKHKFRKDKIICVFNTDPGSKSNFELHEAIKLYPYLKEFWK